MYGYTAYKLYTPSRSFSTSPLAKHMHQRIILSHVAEIRSNKWAVCMYRIYKIRGNERVLSALDKLKATLLTTIGPNRTGYGQSRVMRLWQDGISPGDSRMSPFQDATTLGDVSPTLSFGARNTTEGFRGRFHRFTRSTHLPLLV